MPERLTTIERRFAEINYASQALFKTLSSQTESLLAERAKGREGFRDNSARVALLMADTVCRYWEQISAEKRLKIEEELPLYGEEGRLFPCLSKRVSAAFEHFAQNCPKPKDVGARSRWRTHKNLLDQANSLFSDQNNS